MTGPGMSQPQAASLLHVLRMSSLAALRPSSGQTEPYTFASIPDQLAARLPLSGRV
jgi:hypothetical protein